MEMTLISVRENVRENFVPKIHKVLCFKVTSFPHFTFSEQWNNSLLSLHLHIYRSFFFTHLHFTEKTFKVNFDCHK